MLNRGFLRLLKCRRDVYSGLLQLPAVKKAPFLCMSVRMISADNYPNYDESDNSIDKNFITSIEKAIGRGNGNQMALAEILRNRAVLDPPTTTTTATIFELMGLFTDEVLSMLRFETLSHIVWSFGKLNIRYSEQTEKFLHRIIHAVCNHKDDPSSRDVTTALTGMTNCRILWDDMTKEQQSILLRHIYETLPDTNTRGLANNLLNLSRFRCNWNIDIPVQLEEEYLQKIIDYSDSFITLEFALIVYSFGKLQFSLKTCNEAMRKAVMDMAYRNIEFFNNMDLSDSYYTKTIKEVRMTAL